MCIDERIARAKELIAKRESIATELAAFFAGASTPKKRIKVNPPEKPTSTSGAAATGATAAVFPSEISPAHAGEKPDTARLKTCSDQYHANAATNSNGGPKRNVYVIECKKRLKG